VRWQNSQLELLFWRQRYKMPSSEELQIWQHWWHLVKFLSKRAWCAAGYLPWSSDTDCAIRKLSLRESMCVMQTVHHQCFQKHVMLLGCPQTESRKKHFGGVARVRLNIHICWAMLVLRLLVQ
jgi:hypothetical protein